MEEDELLNAVFRFKHKVPSARQDAMACKALVNCFAAFVADLEEVEVAEHTCGRVEPLADDRVVPASSFAVHEVDALKKVSYRLTASGGTHRRGDVWSDPWLPEYGCVVQRTKLNATMVKIEVLFVDGWERTLHFLPNGECVHSAVPSSHHVLHCADLDTELEARFTTTFASELLNAQASKGSERSAARNKLGHQKTPQFIAAVVRRTVAVLTEGIPSISPVSFAPGGGTTDVGQHTGGLPRDTCWPLVQAVIANNLCCGPGLFRKTMVAIHLVLLQVVVEKSGSAFSADNLGLAAGCASVDDMFYMLQVIVQEVVKLLEDRYDVSRLENRCKVLRSSIDGYVNILNRQTAARYVLPEAKILEDLNKLSCGMEMISPKRFKDSGDGESTEERHQRAWRNLEGCSYLDGASCVLKELLGWNQCNAAPASYNCILMLRTFESFMFKKSLLLSGEGAGDGTVTLENMQTLVTQYQQMMRQWHQLPHLTSILNVEQHSREMLVLWIAFCLAHQKCLKEVPLCARYNIALDWKDLKVAVLSDQAAISALQHVAKYIRSWNTNTASPPLFHLTNQVPTFDFAQRFGQSNTDMVSIYHRYMQNWGTYESETWREIEKKKNEAAELRAQISRQKQDLVAKQLALTLEKERLRREHSIVYLSRPTSGVETQLNHDISHIKSSIQQNQSALERALAVPGYLVRPLPPAVSDAIQVIFMLTMPRYVEILGSLCLTAQRALAPAQATPEMISLPSLSSTTWQEFYYKYAPSRALDATSKVFTATPAPFSFPRSWGPQSVDKLHSLSQYRDECIWDPSLHGTALTWKDSVGLQIDPFRATSSSVIDSFTEAMPSSFQQFQWMNSWPSKGGTRGNLVYANLHQQPEDFEKASFIALGSLRSFPNQQYRKLQGALLTDGLPWSNLCVETIVRQSLYQVGALTDEIKPQLLWKFDMLKDEKGLETHCATLKNIADKLEQTPRNSESVPLLSELAGFALQYTQEARPIVRMFAAMARRWADDARIEYNEEASPIWIAQI